MWELFLQKKSVFVRWMQDIVGRDKVEAELNSVLGELLKKWEKSNHVNNPGLGTVHNYIMTVIYESYHILTSYPMYKNQLFIEVTS